MILLLQPMTMGTATAQSNPIMPDWFKNNAKWWSDGLISDTDMINALESLMIQDVIPLDKFVKPSSGVEHQAGVQKGGTFEIPSYQKNVFQYWSDGVVSDGEIVNSIGHLMSEGIINSEKIQEKRQSFVEATGLELELPEIEYREGDETNLVTKQPGIQKYGNINFKMGTISQDVLDKEFYFNIFKTAKQNESVISNLLKIKNAEQKIAQDTCDKATKNYASDQNFVSMNFMNQWCTAESEMQDIAFGTVQIYEIGGQMVEAAEDYAISMGVSNSDIELFTNQHESEIESFNSIQTESEINSAYKETQKTAKKANEGLQKTFQSILSNNPEYPNLSPSEKNYVSTVINGMEYSDFQIISDASLAHHTDLIAEYNLSPLDGYSDSVGNILSEHLNAVGDVITKELSNEEKEKILSDFIRDYDLERSKIPDKSDNTVFVFLGKDYNVGDKIIDSTRDYEIKDEDAWVNSWDYNIVTITLPDGKTLGMVTQVPKGTLEKIISKEIVEGHQLITEGFSMSTLILNEDVTPYHGPLGYMGLSEDGLITHPDGTTELTEMGTTTITYPDGTVEIIRENGDYEKHSPTGDVKRHYSDADGTSYTEYSDGRIETKDSDGMITIDYPNGSTEVIFPDDDVYFYPAGKEYMEIHRLDGTVEKHYFPGTVDKDGNPLDGFIEIQHPNGSITKKFTSGGEFITKHSDGRISTFYPDGTQLIIHPDDTVELLRPDGTYKITRFDGVIEVGLLDGSIVKLFSDDLIKQVKEIVGPESDTGFTDSGDVYVGTPFVTYGTGIWYMIIGNERHEFTTRDAALDATNELVKKFKNSHSSQPTSESVPETNSNMNHIPVFMFQNNAFPAYQFLIDPADDGCASQHLAPYNQDVVHAINFNDVPGMEWDLFPKRGCGFGILDSENIRYIENYEITDKQASDYTKRFGISPDRPLRTR